MSTVCTKNLLRSIQIESHFCVYAREGRNTEIGTNRDSESAREIEIFASETEKERQGRRRGL